MTGKNTAFDTRMVDELAAAETIDLEAEFEAINELNAEITYQARGIDEEITRLMELRQKVTGPYEEAIQFHTRNIENAVLLDAKTFKCQYGKATYRRESERSSWDNKALLGYAAAHPEIEQFRKITPVKASVSISFEGDVQ